MLCFALRMQFITNMASTARAAILIDVVCGARKRPLVGIHLRAADVTDLSLRQPHLLFGAGRMLLLGKVILAKSPVAIRTMPKRFLVTFMTATRGGHDISTRLYFRAIPCSIFHLMSSPYIKMRLYSPYIDSYGPYI